MLHEKLKDFRKAAHLTQQQVSDTIGVKRSAYAYYEIGKSTPKLNILKKLADLYGVTIDELLENSEIASVAQSDEPDFVTGWSTTDKFNDLSAFEQSVLLKIRLMSKEQKAQLMEYLCKI